MASLGHNELIRQTAWHLFTTHWSQVMLYGITELGWHWIVTQPSAWLISEVQWQSSYQFHRKSLKQSSKYVLKFAHLIYQSHHAEAGELTHWGLVTAIWQQRSGSTLAQVMACCLTAPSHYLNQCWLIISKVLWHSSEGIVMRRSEETNQ